MMMPAGLSDEPLESFEVRPPDTPPGRNGSGGGFGAGGGAGMGQGTRLYTSLSRFMCVRGPLLPVAAGAAFSGSQLLMCTSVLHSPSASQSSPSSTVSHVIIAASVSAEGHSLCGMASRQWPQPKPASLPWSFFGPEPQWLQCAASSAPCVAPRPMPSGSLDRRSELQPAVVDAPAVSTRPFGGFT